MTFGEVIAASMRVEVSASRGRKLPGMTVSDDIAAYLAGLPDDQRSALQTLRDGIAAAAPGAEEGFSYGAPAFRYRDRPLVCYSAAKAHL